MAIKILYGDDLFPHDNGPSGRKYSGRTIEEILSTHANPRLFVKGFNSKNDKYCISDEVMVDTKKGYFNRR